MENEEILLQLIIKNYSEHIYHDVDEFMSIVNIIQKYPLLCFELLSKVSLVKRERIPLLMGCIASEKVFDDLCKCKTYIRKTSIEEQNIILNNSTKEQIFIIVNTCTNISYHPNKLVLDKEKEEFVSAAILMKKLTKS